MKIYLNTNEVVKKKSCNKSFHFHLSSNSIKYLLRRFANMISSISSTHFPATHNEIIISSIVGGAPEMQSASQKESQKV